MSKKLEEKSAEAIQEILFPFGRVLELADGMSVYVIPLEKLKELSEKDLAELKREIEARELVKRAKERAMKHVKDGWTREDFQRQFLESHRKISQFLSEKVDEPSQ